MEMSKKGFQGVMDYLWDRETFNDNVKDDLVILGKSYKPIDVTLKSNAEEQGKEQDSIFVQIANNFEHTEGNSVSQLNNLRLNNIKTFLQKMNITTQPVENRVSDTSIAETNETIKWPKDFLDDLDTRIWLTYRSGFPIIEKDKNGPSTLTFGSLIRGTFDLSNSRIGFTSDAGWGCMIRTSQSLVANALLNLYVGRDWRFRCDDDDIEDEEYQKALEKHWEIIEMFADTPKAKFSIHKFVEFAARYCGKKPGEWFGPSDAAKSIQGLCNMNADQIGLKIYLAEDSGDIYEDELLDLAEDNDKNNDFFPILILTGIRLGVRNVNQIYWDFLKFLLDISQSAGIAGGRPSSSHYFFGYQGDYLFYLDPHIPQHALLLSENNSLSSEDKKEYISTIHTKKIRRLNLDQVDPSMLLGLLIKNRNDYYDLKAKISRFLPTKRFLNIYPTRPFVTPRNSSGSIGLEESGFVDLGVESMNEDEEYEGEGQQEGEEERKEKREEIEGEEDEGEKENGKKENSNKKENKTPSEGDGNQLSCKGPNDSVVIIGDEDQTEEAVVLEATDELEAIVTTNEDNEESEICHHRKFSAPVIISKEETSELIKQFKQLDPDVSAIEYQEINENFEEIEKKEASEESEEAILISTNLDMPEPPT